MKAKLSRSTKLELITGAPLSTMRSLSTSDSVVVGAASVVVGTWETESRKSCWF